MQLNNGKSPGKDGLPNEFYKVFRKVLTPILKDVYDEIFLFNHLPVILWG